MRFAEEWRNYFLLVFDCLLAIDAFRKSYEGLVLILILHDFLDSAEAPDFPTLAHLFEVVYNVILGDWLLEVRGDLPYLVQSTVLLIGHDIGIGTKIDLTERSLQVGLKIDDAIHAA